jgi:PAS domain-containing protein
MTSRARRVHAFRSAICRVLLAMAEIFLRANRQSRVAWPRLSDGWLRPTPSLLRQTRHLVSLARYAPAAALIDHKFRVLYFHGPTGDYLEQPTGEPTRDLLAMALVISFTDITDSKRAADRVNEARIYAEGIVHTVRQPLLVLDGDLRVESANPAFYQLFQVTPAQTEGQLVYELASGQWDIPKLRTLLEEVLPKGQAFSNIEIAHEFSEIGLRCMLLNGRSSLRKEIMRS